MSAPSVEDRLRASISALRSRLEQSNTPITPAELADLTAQLKDLLEQLDAERAATSRRFKWYSADLGRIEERLSRVENSIVFRSLRAIGGTLTVTKRKLG